MSKRPVSLKDLATELGVSISTISRALNNHPDISPELTKNIQQLARDRNYTPNPLAMGLLRQQTKMIGVIVPDIVTFFYSSIISGVEDIAKSHGYYIVIASSNENYNKEKESVENLLKTRVEGFIICQSQETENYSHFEKLIELQIPLVLFDRVNESLHVPKVTVDGVKAACELTRHFYENGCRRIAYISGPKHLNISMNRYEGYLVGLNECGLEFDSRLLEMCNLNAKDATEATRRLLKQNPDAIFGLNDTIAFAAMKEIKRNGLKIPENIALAGFTDEFHSTVVDPTLTSVTHPTFEIGKQAATLFFKLVDKGNNFDEEVKLETELIVRESSVRKY